MKKSITSIVFIVGMLAMSIGTAADLKKLNTQNNMEINTSSQQNATGQNGINNFGIAFSPNCAQGFSLFGKKDGKNGFLEGFVCGTKTIKCPAQLQDNGLYAHVTPKAVINKSFVDPDGGEVRFHVQYKCDYRYNALPEG